MQKAPCFLYYTLDWQKIEIYIYDLLCAYQPEVLTQALFEDGVFLNNLPN